ncbi:MAG: hypothetical protein HYT28_00800 [Parcubacteria group bacterium]|nr:hypothetical protein [Parcubacteria group bacterium]
MSTDQYLANDELYIGDTDEIEGDDTGDEDEFGEEKEDDTDDAGEKGDGVEESESGY